MTTWECDNCGALGPRRSGPCPRCRLSSARRTERREQPEDNRWLSSLVDDLGVLRGEARRRVLEPGEVFGVVKVTGSALNGEGWQDVTWESPYAKGNVSTPMYQ